MHNSALPLVSIIIPNYNYGRYISEAIDSVLAQTYPNIELIVVDDGSTDNSIGEIKHYTSKLTLISQKNSGVVVARNSGAAKAAGQYICFLDADDMLAPTFIEKLLQPFLHNQNGTLAVAYCDFHYFGKEEAKISACPWNPRKLLYRNYIIAAALIKRSVFDELGGFSSEVNQKASFEDWDFWLSMVEAGYQGVYIPEALFHYRLHGKGRNIAALKKRSELEAILHKRHPKLYGNWKNQMYLAVFQTASRIRNKVLRPPGT